MLRIYIHELCTLESVFLIIRNSTVEDCLACDSVICNEEPDEEAAAACEALGKALA